MSSSMIDSMKKSQEALRARWGGRSIKTPLTVTGLGSLEQWIKHLKEGKLGFHKSAARAKKKCSLLRKRMRNITLHNVVARIVPFKNQTSRSHRSTTKSVKSTSPSGSSDGSGDSDRDPKVIRSYYIHTLFSALISTPALIAHISNVEVKK